MSRHDWTEILSLVGVVGMIAIQTDDAGGIATQWIAAGIVGGGVAVGPVAWSRYGQRFGGWVRSLDAEGRIAVIGSLFLAGSAVAWLVVPLNAFLNFVLGVMVATSVVAATENLGVVRHGQENDGA